MQFALLCWFAISLEFEICNINCICMSAVLNWPLIPHTRPVDEVIKTAADSYRAKPLGRIRSTERGVSGIYLETPLFM